MGGSGLMVVDLGLPVVFWCFRFCGAVLVSGNGCSGVCWWVFWVVIAGLISTWVL